MWLKVVGFRRGLRLHSVMEVTKRRRRRLHRAASSGANLPGPASFQEALSILPMGVQHLKVKFDDPDFEDLARNAAASATQDRLGQPSISKLRFNFTTVPIPKPPRFQNLDSKIPTPTPPRLPNRLDSKTVGNPLAPTSVETVSQSLFTPLR